MSSQWVLTQDGLSSCPQKPSESHLRSRNILQLLYDTVGKHKGVLAMINSLSCAWTQGKLFILSCTHLCIRWTEVSAFTDYIPQTDPKVKALIIKYNYKHRQMGLFQCCDYYLGQAEKMKCWFEMRMLIVLHLKRIKLIRWTKN